MIKKTKQKPYVVKHINVSLQKVGKENFKENNEKTSLFGEDGIVISLLTV